MRTEHRVVVGDSRDMTDADDDSVDLVVTSPPYPMIEMWDETFAALDSRIGAHLDAGDGGAAFDLMHETLLDTWREIQRVLSPGGIACINVGDATRSIDGRFRVYQNHARIVEAFETLGFDPLPEILWRKPTNSAAKFMGSGMLPPNAYVTLEHEYLLIFRNGPRRTFDPGADRRYRAAYFWEERNEWFSDVWTDVNGIAQSFADGPETPREDDDSTAELRDRAAAFPLDIPYRLINMYSVYGDTVLDPFWGTGTTSLAAMVAGRNSVGYERDPSLTPVFERRLDGIERLARDVVTRRLERHREFVDRRRSQNETPEYPAEHYDFPVVTKQEQQVQFYTVSDVEHSEDGIYTAYHEPV